MKKEKKKKKTILPEHIENKLKKEISSNINAENIYLYLCKEINMKSLFLYGSCFSSDCRSIRKIISHFFECRSVSAWRTHIRP